MDVYVYPIASAVAIFPLLSAVITIPYVINQYHKYGALLMLRIVLVYSFIFYMLTSYFMTILPLPPIDSVEGGGTSMLLVPFHALRMWWENCGFVWNDPSTYLNSFLNYDFFQIFFNIMLLLPFGVYLRYYFERKWYQVLLMSLAYSLFFELTQLSGLYGIYPHAYRWFEVDDLICNSLGGVLGYLITPLCSFFLPNRDKLDDMSYQKGRRISFIRRGLANLVDWALILSLLFLFKRYVWKGSPFKNFILDFDAKTLVIIVGFTFLYFVISSWIMSGKTIGKYLVSLQVKGIHGKRVKLYQYLLRYGFLYLLVIPTPAYILKLLEYFIGTQNILIKTLCGIGITLLGINVLYFVINVFVSVIIHGVQMSHEKLSNTFQASVVKIQEDSCVQECSGKNDMDNQDDSAENWAAVTEESDDE